MVSDYGFHSVIQTYMVSDHGFQIAFQKLIQARDFVLLFLPCFLPRFHTLVCDSGFKPSLTAESVNRPGGKSASD